MQQISNPAGRTTAAQLAEFANVSKAVLETLAGINTHGDNNAELATRVSKLPAIKAAQLVGDAEGAQQLLAIVKADSRRSVVKATLEHGDVDSTVIQECIEANPKALSNRAWIKYFSRDAHEHTGNVAHVIDKHLPKVAEDHMVAYAARRCVDELSWGEPLAGYKDATSWLNAPERDLAKPLQHAMLRGLLDLTAKEANPGKDTPHTQAWRAHQANVRNAVETLIAQDQLDWGTFDVDSVAQALCETTSNPETFTKLVQLIDSPERYLARTLTEGDPLCGKLRIDDDTEWVAETLSYAHAHVRVAPTATLKAAYQTCAEPQLMWDMLESVEGHEIDASNLTRPDIVAKWSKTADKHLRAWCDYYVTLATGDTAAGKRFIAWAAEHHELATMTHTVRRLLDANIFLLGPLLDAGADIDMRTFVRARNPETWNTQTWELMLQSTEGSRIVIGCWPKLDENGARQLEHAVISVANTQPDSYQPVIDAFARLAGRGPSLPLTNAYANFIARGHQAGNLPFNTQETTLLPWVASGAEHLDSFIEALGAHFDETWDIALGVAIADSEHRGDFDVTHLHDHILRSPHIEREDVPRTYVNALETHLQDNEEAWATWIVLHCENPTDDLSNAHTAALLARIS